MKGYVQYDPATGRIEAQMFCSESQIAIQDRSFKYLQGEADSRTQYVQGGVVVPRPIMPVSVDGLTLSGVPVGAALTVEYDEFQVLDSTVLLSLPLPGSYPVRVVKFPYVDFETEVQGGAGN